MREREREGERERNREREREEDRERERKAGWKEGERERGDIEGGEGGCGLTWGEHLINMKLQSISTQAWWRGEAERRIGLGGERKRGGEEERRRTFGRGDANRES